jgi:hypothetical protein
MMVKLDNSDTTFSYGKAAYDGIGEGNENAKCKKAFLCFLILRLLIRSQLSIKRLN